MSCMFLKSRFNGNISNWDVSNVEDMSWMFGRSVFDGDLANWDVSNVKNMNHMFSGGLGSKKINPFNGDISGWNVSNVMDMRYMYNNSEFNGNIDSWNVNKKTKKEGMFWGCPLDKRMPIWYNFRGAGWFEKNYKEGDVLDSIVDKAAESISKAESVKRTDIKLDRIEPYIKASIENYCKKYDIDTDDNQIRFAAENLKKYLAVKYGLLQKFEDRTILEPILKQAIESIRKSENAQAAATAQKNDITIAMLVPYIKDSIEKYCQENNIKADNNQIQWVAVKLARYYENISWLIGKLRVKTVLEPIINHAIELIRKSEKNIITPYKILPHVKDSVQLYCQENNIDADDSQIQWISFALTRYFDYVCWLGKNFKEKVDLEPIINQAIESIRMSENAKVNVVGQKKNITIDMVEPYVKESIEKYYQENKIDANDNQLQWAANMLTKIFRNECIRKGKEKATRAKMKEMLTSDAEEDLS